MGPDGRVTQIDLRKQPAKVVSFPWTGKLKPDDLAIYQPHDLVPSFLRLRLVAFGNLTTLEWHNGTTWIDKLTTGTMIRNPYLFQGRRYDPETKYYYFRHRYYNPETGRFISRDPLGTIDGPNLYAFVNNNPINLVDPMGLTPEERALIEYLIAEGDYGSETVGRLRSLRNDDYWAEHGDQRVLHKSRATEARRRLLEQGIVTNLDEATKYLQTLSLRAQLDRASETEWYFVAGVGIALVDGPEPFIADAVAVVFVLGAMGINALVPDDPYVTPVSVIQEGLLISGVAGFPIIQEAADARDATRKKIFAQEKPFLAHIIKLTGLMEVTQGNERTGSNMPARL